MNSTEIRNRFLRFFQKRGHTVIQSASLVTPDEKGVTDSTLFNTAGMQPLVPYLLGKPYVFEGKEVTRLVDVQKCLRTVDLDDVGDKTHATFFEMLGNWSLGDYFKKEAINWSYEFLTDKKEGLGLDPTRLYITVFSGDENSVQDIESAQIWESVGIPKQRIYFKDAASNWWPAVKSGKEDGWTGPTGPCSEMFYDISAEGLGDMTQEQFEQAENDQKVVEIWNDVFMEFEKDNGKIIGKLAKKNVDTGAGLERLATVLQKVDNIYDTDLFLPVIESINKQSKIDLARPKRIIADHIRSSVILIADGVTPSNSDRGYVLRRIIRRASRYSKELGLTDLSQIISVAIGTFGDLYDLKQKKDYIIKVLTEEITKFETAVSEGLKKIEKVISTKVPIENGKFMALMNDTRLLPRTSFENRRNNKPFAIDAVPLSEKEVESALITGKEAFDIYQTFGLPIEIIVELARERRLLLDRGGYREELKAHQSLSRSGAEQKFKGGLADAHDEMVIRYHTATHLLHQALHDVLGDNANQKGSNITKERLRFDFSHSAKMTDEEKKKVEDIVNQKIAEKLPMNNVVLSREEAEKTGARHFFGEKYGEQISIYFIGNDLASAYSKEFCGGPPVKNTSELAGPEGKRKFKIQKEEAVAQGVRRIKAVML